MYTFLAAIARHSEKVKVAMRSSCSFPLSLLFCLAFAGPLRADLVTFDNLLEGDVLTNQLASQGVTVSGDPMILTAGSFLNEVEFPPHSGANVLTDANGPISFAFAPSVNAIGGFFTYTVQLTFELFDLNGQLLKTVQTAGVPNLGTSERFDFNSLSGDIAVLKINGSAGGFSFTLDDLSFSSVPEPSSLLLLAPVIFWWLWCRRRKACSLGRALRYRLLALAALGGSTLCAQIPVRRVDAPILAPTSVSVNTPVVVTIVAAVAYNPSLIQQSLTLTEVTQDGRLISVLGPMYDDGTHGDAVAADLIYTKQIVVNRAAPVSLWYRATAAYQGSVLRTQSPVSRLSVVNQTCTCTIEPRGSTPAPAGGTGTIFVTASPDCSWSASANVSWISILSITPGAGSGTITYRVDANSSENSRTGTIFVGSNSFQVTQAGVTCAYSIDASGSNQPAAGGTGSVSVLAPQGCSWMASSNTSWISITSGASGSGMGKVDYKVDPNPLESPRSGTLTIAGRDFTIAQLGASSAPVCSASGTPAAIRSTGLSELAGGLTVTCTKLPPSGIIADVIVTCDAPITSRQIPGENFTEALLLVNEPAIPAVGLNSVQGIAAAASTLRFPNVTIAPAAGDTASLQVVNLRVNAASAAGTGLRATVDLVSNSAVSVSNPQITVAILSEPAVAGVVVTPPVANFSAMTITVKELLATAFRTRIGAAGAIDPAVESGFWSQSLNSSVGTAFSGTRFRAVFAAIPGVNIYAPVYADGSQAAQLVSADGSGAGGAFMSGSSFGGTHVLLAAAGGAITATWEVRSANPLLIDQYTFPVVIEGASAEQLASILRRVTLSPVSTASYSSETAPLPRFTDTPLRLVP